MKSISLICSVLVILSCSSKQDERLQVSSGIKDSTFSAVDSLSSSVLERSEYLDSFTKVAVYQIEKKIKSLNKEKEKLMKERDSAAGFSEDHKQEDSEREARIRNLEQENTVYQSRLKTLRSELEIAEKENKQQEYVVTKSRMKQYQVPVPVAQEKPDDNSLVIKFILDGLILPDDLVVYLVPYTKDVKRYAVYEASCNLNGVDELLISKRNGDIFFFNSVEPGKYLIKVCTYYGNFKIYTKTSGRQRIEMELAPPLQKKS